MTKLIVRWILALVFIVMVQEGSAQTSNSDPFSKISQWSATESWGKDKLIYTFDPKGTFKSSSWDNGKGQGTWTRAGKQFVMIWPGYGGVLYQGTIEGKEIRGAALNPNGSSIGTFVFTLAP